MSDRAVPSRRPLRASRFPGVRSQRSAGDDESLMTSPVYLLLAVMTPIRAWLRDGIVTRPLLESVTENQWLNLLEPTVLAQITASTLTPEQALKVSPYWVLNEEHYEALRAPQVRKLIEKGIFSFDRYASLNAVQCSALLSSEALCSQLLQGKMTAPSFLRHSPSQLKATVDELKTPNTIL